MNFELSDEQMLLKEQVGRLLNGVGAEAGEQARLVVGDGHDRALWLQLTAMGLCGAVIDEAEGGVELDELSLGLIVEALGKVVAPTPFFSSICLAAEAIRLAGNREQRAHLLPGMADGSTIGTLAWSEGAGSATSASALHEVNGKISGIKLPVPDCAAADIAVIVAVRSDGEPGLGMIDLRDSGVHYDRLDGFDLNRPHYRLSLADVPVEWLEHGDGEMIEHLRDRAAIYAAFEQIGGAEGCLYMARDYVLTRPVFGRSLGSYQAVKHRLAELLVQIELARSNAYYAAWSLNGDPIATRAAAAAARIAATRAYEFGAQENLQLHGGIGFTLAVGCHYHYRRARLLALALGSIDFWSRRLVAAFGSRAA